MTPNHPAAPAALPAVFPHAPAFPTDLPQTDGEPLESDWHRLAINLLVEVVRFFFRAHRDFFAGGNMFLYFSEEQVRNQDYRGPDFFFVWGVERDKERPYYVVWQEGGRYPNVIIELLSPSTAHVDRTTKKALYERVFSTPEYFLYDPDTRQLEGWHLVNAHYEPMERDERGWIWSRQLELFVGTWEGEFQEARRTWLRFYDVHGNLLLTGRESGEERAEHAEKRAEDEKRRADDEKRRADDEKRRADAATRRADDEKRRAERLAEKLRSLGIDPEA